MPRRLRGMRYCGKQHIQAIASSSEHLCLGDVTSAQRTGNAVMLCVRMSSMILQTAGGAAMWYVRRPVMDIYT